MAKSAELQRLASLSDCVFAVAMTLLAFNVRVPEQGVDRAKLPGELTRMFGESYGLVLSFAITAMFWVGHVRLLRSLAQATPALIYLVLLQLFWIVLLPISTSLWIRIEAKETVMIMGADLTLTALCGLLMWVYSHRNKLFERSALTHPVVIEIIGPIFPLRRFVRSHCGLQFLEINSGGARSRPLLSSISPEAPGLPLKHQKKEALFNRTKITTTSLQKSRA